MHGGHRSRLFFLALQPRALGYIFFVIPFFCFVLSADDAIMDGADGPPFGHHHERDVGSDFLHSGVPTVVVCEGGKTFPSLLAFLAYDTTDESLPLINKSLG